MGSLLIDQRGRYDVRRSASVALIGRLLLNYGTHLLSLTWRQLATPGS